MWQRAEDTHTLFIQLVCCTCSRHVLRGGFRKKKVMKEERKGKNDCEKEKAGGGGGEAVNRTTVSASD